MTCGSVLVVGDSTTDEYMHELRTLLSNLGVGHVYIAHSASDGECGSSFGLASCIEPYLQYHWSVIVLGWAHRDIKPNSYGVVTVSEYRNNLWETYTSLKGSLAPGGSMVFMTAVPVGASYQQRDNDDAKELNEEALQLFENEDMTIVNHYDRIVETCRRDPGLSCYPETCDCARLQSDGVHGTSEGRWHKAVAVADAIVATPDSINMCSEALGAKIVAAEAAAAEAVDVMLATSWVRILAVGPAKSIICAAARDDEVGNRESAKSRISATRNS